MGLSFQQGKDLENKQISRYSPTKGMKQGGGKQGYKLVVRAGSLCGIREDKMILKSPCSVNEPPLLGEQPAHGTHTSAQSLSEVHTRQNTQGVKRNSSVL